MAIQRLSTTVSESRWAVEVCSCILKVQLNMLFINHCGMVGANDCKTLGEFYILLQSSFLSCRLLDVNSWTLKVTFVPTAEKTR